MKCTIISGRSGSGKTGILLDRLSREKDNLVVTTDPAVVYIEMYMARNNIPGRCVGINSLAKIVAQDINLITAKESTKEVEIAIISKILKEGNFETFNEDNYNNGLVNKIHSFITECKEANISPKDLSSVASKTIVSLEVKLKDMEYIYREYNKILNENGFLTKDDLVSYVASSLSEQKLSFPFIFIDTIDRYNKNTIVLIESLISACEEITIAFNRTSKKAFDYNIYQEGMNAMIDVLDYIGTLDGCGIERIEATSTKDINNGLSIIEKELFNKDTETKSNADNVVLHQASTLYKEVDFLISQISNLIKNGAKYSEIIVTSSSMDRYINIISAAMKKHNIPYYYFKNTTIEKTYLFQFLDTILDVKINDLNSENLLRLCHLNFLGLTQEEIVAVDTFYNRFGDDLIVAMKNGKKYDSNNTLTVQSIVQKIMMPINNINDAPRNVKEFMTSLYSYFNNIGIQNIIIEKANQAEQEGFIHSSKEIINTWNDIMSIFNNIVTIFGNEKMDIDEIREILYKMASEKITNNSDLYHSQLTILDIDNAQNRKSKYLFVIGCNEGYMPKPVGVQLISDREKVIINSELNSNLRLSTIYQNYKNAAIFNALILPQEKLFLSWSANDIDFKPLRYASILNNVVKTFEDNIIKEEDFYNNDEEERFINLLENISLNHYKGIDKETLDDDFQHFVSSPEYNKRLAKALSKMNNCENEFHATNIMEGYKETEYFSVSRIETFNECPFKHYVDFALNPQKRKLFEETAADKGTYYHLVFKVFFDKCINKEINIINVTHEEYEKELEEVFNYVDTIHNENFLNSNAKNKYLSYTMKERVKTSLWNAILQIRRGSYEILANEYVVGKNVSLDLDAGDEIIHITGTIDRIDVCGEYARIIDYKSGNTTFSTDAIDLGIQLQLPLYAKAVGRDSDISGMYYFRIKDFIADADTINAPLKDFKLNGPTIKDIDIIKNNDNELDDGTSSSIISADLTLKGEISKKSKVMSQAEMQTTIDTATNVAINTVKQIKAGVTTAHPLVIKDLDACKYCKYRCICNIDRTSKSAIRKGKEG